MLFLLPFLGLSTRFVGGEPGKITAANVTNSRLEVQKCVFTGFSSPEFGGAIYVHSAAMDSYISANYYSKCVAGVDGGAVYLQCRYSKDGYNCFYDCLCSQSQPGYGYGLGLAMSSRDSDVLFESTAVSSSICDSGSMAIYNFKSFTNINTSYVGMHFSAGPLLFPNELFQGKAIFIGTYNTYKGSGIGFRGYTKNNLIERCNIVNVTKSNGVVFFWTTNDVVLNNFAFARSDNLAFFGYGDHSTVTVVNSYADKVMDMSSQLVTSVGSFQVMNPAREHTFGVLGHRECQGNVAPKAFESFSFSIEYKQRVTAPSLYAFHVFLSGFY